MARKWIGIVGTRQRNHEDDYIKCLNVFKRVFHQGDYIVSGGCPVGGDNFAERIAKQLQIPIMIFYAEWDRLGKSAGMQRNTFIANQCDVLIAVVDAGREGGTEDTIKKVLNLGKPVLLCQ